MYTFRFLTISDLERIQYTNPFPSTRYKWISNWFKVFEEVENNTVGFSKKPYVVGAYKEDHLVAIVPLLKLERVYFKFIKIKFLEFLGQQWSSLGHDILTVEALDESFTRELSKWIRKNISYDYLFLKYLPKKSVLANRFHFFHYSAAPCMQLNQYTDYEDFSKKVYSRKFREELRRTARKIKKDGYDFEVEIKDITKENIKEIKEIAKSKEVDGKKFLYGNAEKEAFHLKIYEDLPSKLMLLKMNKKIVAYATTIDWNGTRIGIDASFDRSYRKYGIGIHCVNETVKNGFQDGKEKLSLGLGLDFYKFRFADHIDQFYMCVDYKYRLKALLALPYFQYQLKKKEQDVLKTLEKTRFHVQA
jgi:hypothetical protein